MRKLALAFLFCLLSPIANAEKFESRKVIVCDNTESILRQLAQDFEEYPMWTGREEVDGTTAVLMVNSKTGSWTIIQYSSKVACVIAVGDSSKMLGKPI
jgi:hypothetical protein